MDIDGACMSSVGVISECAGMRCESIDAVVEEIDDCSQDRESKNLCCWIDIVKMGLDVLYGSASAERLKYQWADVEHICDEQHKRGGCFVIDGMNN